MVHTFRGIEIGQRIQTAIDRSGRSRMAVAEAANIEQSRLSRICKGERPITDEDLERLARVLGVSAKDLIGAETSTLTANSEDDSEMSAGSAKVRALSRFQQGRSEFLTRYSDDLTAREREWLGRIRVEVDDDPDFAPEGEQFWWSFIDLYRARERNRRGGDQGR